MFIELLALLFKGFPQVGFIVQIFIETYTA